VLSSTLRYAPPDGPAPGSAVDAVAGLEAALSSLRGATSTGELIRTGADAVLRLGFDRALVSAVHEGRWTPMSMSDPRDPAWAERILEAGRADRPVLDGRLVESDLGVARPAILVRDAQRHPRVHEGLAGTALAGSYIAVPLLAGGRVVGLVHADCYYRRREPDELAGRLLGVLAEVLAQALLRAAATEQLAALGSELTRLSGSLPRGDPNAPPDVSLRAPAHVPGGQDQPTRCPSTASRYRLTRRQVEVLELVAEGHTNAVIGRKLFITQDTVKSHVKLLLRKFNAGNRAELVSRWLNLANR